MPRGPVATDELVSKVNRSTGNRWLRRHMSRQSDDGRASTSSCRVHGQLTGAEALALYGVDEQSPMYHGDHN